MRKMIDGWLVNREDAVVSVNGHMIRPVKTGQRIMYTVDGTGERFSEQVDAEAHAATLIPRRGA